MSDILPLVPYPMPGDWTAWVVPACARRMLTEDIRTDEATIAKIVEARRLLIEAERQYAKRAA